MNIRNQAIVANIKDIATMRRTTIKQIEKDLGFGNGMIGKWKSAPKSPPFEKIEMIAEYLGVTVDDLTNTADTQAEYPELWAAAEAKIRMDDALAGIKKDAPGPQAESDLERRFRAAAAKLPPELLERELVYLEQLVQQLHSPTDSDM